MRRGGGGGVSMGFAVAVAGGEELFLGVASSSSAAASSSAPESCTLFVRAGGWSVSFNAGSSSNVPVKSYCREFRSP